jgi:hypothetical protein
MLALHTRRDSWFYYSFLNTTENRKTIESACHSLGLLLKDYWGPLTLKWCNLLTCTSAKCKRSLLSGWPLYKGDTKGGDPDRLSVGAVNLGCFFIYRNSSYCVHKSCIILHIHGSLPICFNRCCILATGKRLCLQSSLLSESPDLNRNCWKYNIMGHTVQASGVKGLNT